MRFWQCISYTHPVHMTALARAAEAAGFDGLMLSEHLLHPLQQTSVHPYSPADAPPLETDEDWAEVMQCSVWGSIPIQRDRQGASHKAHF